MPSGTRFYYWLKRNGWPNERPLQTLCVPCHAVKSGQERAA
jgi:hypothetical protein